MTYYVEEKKKLCEECATKTGGARKERKGGISLFCEKHDQPITMYCKTHDVSVCHLCAVMNHQRPCELQDVDDTIAEKKQQLLDLQATARDKTTVWKKYGYEIRLCGEDANNHLKSVQDQVDSLIDDEIKKVKDKAQREAAVINKEADDEITRINKEREKSLKQRNADAQNQLKIIEGKRRLLHSDVTMISDTVQTKINDLQKQAMDVMETIDTTVQRIEDLLQDDKELVNGVQEVIASFTDRLGKTVEEGVVEHITRTVRGVRFIEGVGKEKYNGRIGGFGEKWVLTETISISNKNACIAGSISDTVIMSSFSFPQRLSVINLTDKIVTEKMVSSKSHSYIWSCALLNEDTIVCGMGFKLKSPTENTLDDVIRLYDKEWNLIKSISLPHNTKNDRCKVDVDGKDGMVIAAERGQTKIYVINPTDGEIVDTITCKREIVLCGTLSTGDFIAIPSPVNDKVIFIDRRHGRGTQREIAIGGTVYKCGIDSLTADLFPVYHQEGKDAFVVDHLKSNGEVKAKDVLEYTPSTLYERYARLIITPSGRLVVCDGKTFLIYRNTFCF